MEYFYENGEVRVTGVTEFNLERTFECGQCFRWDRNADGSYSGVAFGKAARVRRDGGSVYISGTPEDFESVWRDYFDLDRDYTAIRQRLCVDAHMEKATQFGEGIRILRQEAWEALCSFIISQCNNIKRIKSIIAVLCENFGEDFYAAGGERYKAFPTAETISWLTERDLAPLRCGYRAEYITAAAKAVAYGELDLDALASGSSGDALRALKTVRGVGTKVANCVMLFGLHMLDAFPLDVWMKRAVREHYGKDFDPEVFAPYAGIAQQYIFYYARSGNTSADKKGAGA